MKVGFIGLGRMGGAMVGRLLQGGHEVGVYNRTPAKLKPFTDAGAKAVDSIKAAAQFGDAVFELLTVLRPKVVNPQRLGERIVVL